jgi:predicted nucleotide-binding protein (sugar kinase/HSP70/actin superfamily)
MYVGNRVSQHFIEELETFFETAAEYKKPENNMSDVHYICCPCVDCYNEKKTRDIEEIREHLLIIGFMSGYTCWTEHGEYKEVMLEDTDVGDDDNNVDQTNYCWT